MPEKLSAFYLPFAPASATFSTEEELERRKLVWREVRGLMPVVDSLPNSRLVDRIGWRGHETVLYFDLEYSGQMPLTLTRGGIGSPLQLLQHDLDLLRQSAAAQQNAAFLDASAPEESGLSGRGRRTGNPATSRLHNLMKLHEGQTLVLPFANGPMVFAFPGYPDFRYDGVTRTISANVVQARPYQVQLRGIRYDGEDDPAAKTLGKERKRFALLPMGPDRRMAGMLSATAQYHELRLVVRVRTALHFLEERISHYEIVEIVNRDELQSKLGDV